MRKTGERQSCLKFSHCLSAGSEIGEHHFGIFAREDNAFGAGFERCGGGSGNVLGRGLFVVSAGRDINVDAGIDFAFAMNISERTASLSENVIRGKAFGRKVLERRFVGIIEPFVVKAGEFVFRHVVENRGSDVINVIGVARAAAVIIDDDFQVVGHFGEFRVILFSAEEGTEGIRVPDMEADLDIRSALLRRVINIGINGVFTVSPKFFPREQFGIIKEQTPELHEIAIGGPFVGVSGTDVLIEFFKTFFGALEIDASFFGGFLVMLAKAGDAG